MKDYANSSFLDVSNPAPRCPVILLLDTSASMSGAPINELNKGVRQFLNETRNDEAASMSVELEIVTFDSSVTRVIPFKSISSVKSLPTFQAN